MWRKGHFYKLLVGIQTGTVITETTLKVLQKTKNTSINYPAFKYIYKVNEINIPKRYLYTQVYFYLTTIHNS